MSATRKDSHRPDDPGRAPADSAAASATYVSAHTDKYFSKSRAIVEKFGDQRVTYGVFLRRSAICAVNPALDVLHRHYPAAATMPLELKRQFADGEFVPDQKPLFIYSGSFAALVELETLVLQKVGVACIAAFNACRMATSLAKAAFIDMHARHSPGDDFSLLAAYGASVGSKVAQQAGATGFVGSSQDLTAPFYGGTQGMGTMPHAIIGYAGSTLRAAQLYVATYPHDNLTVLIDFFGREYADALEVCQWWYARPESAGKTLSLRIDTHGERYAEGLDYGKSVAVVANWLRVANEYEAVRQVMGEDAFDADSLDIAKDRVRKLLFGTGVSLASVIQLRLSLDAAGFPACRIVASSGFNLFKCRMFAGARAPVDVVGTGSFIPDNLSETFATADIFMYGEDFRIKLGREKIFNTLPR
jgi:nicotinate phosphoribosyltransferase